MTEVSVGGAFVMAIPAHDGPFWVPDRVPFTQIDRFPVPVPAVNVVEAPVGELIEPRAVFEIVQP